MASIRSGMILVGLAIAAAACDPSFNDEGPPVSGLPVSNRPPALTDKTADTDANVPVTVDVLVGVADPDGDSLTVLSAVVTSGGGTAEVRSGRNVTVTPSPGFSGSLSVTYLVSDGHVTVNGLLTVNVGNHAPTASSDNETVVNDSSIALFLQGSDPENQPLTFRIVTPPANGTFIGVPPFVTYTPNAFFVGTDSLTFTVNDGKITSLPATVTITVTQANRAPTASSQSVSTSEDVPLSITLAGSDPDSDALTFFIDRGPSHGFLSFTGPGPQWIYTPFTNSNGPDSFTYFVDDGMRSSSDATVAIDVAAVNDPPFPLDRDATLNEDTTATISLLATDPEGDPISFAIADGPHHGTATLSGSSVTYRPDHDYNGSDSFTYTASDSTATSAPATVSLTVRPINDAPVASDGSTTTAEDTSVTFTLPATDVDGQPLTYTVVTVPSDGFVSFGTGASRTYTPAANATGVRTLTFRVSDGFTSSNTATFTITITPVNDPPVAVDDWVATNPGEQLTIDVVANDLDVDQDHLTVTAFDQPANGSVDLVDNKLVYTPAGDFSGVDTFRYTAADPSNTVGSATVHVGVGLFPTGAPAETILALAVDTSDPGNAPSMSADSRYVAFTTMLPLVPESTSTIAAPGPSPGSARPAAASRPTARAATRGSRPTAATSCSSRSPTTWCPTTRTAASTCSATTASPARPCGSAWRPAAARAPAPARMRGCPMTATGSCSRRPRSTWSTATSTAPPTSSSATSRRAPPRASASA
jgi:hypothetical protein